MCESGRALDWLLREGTYAIVVLRSINLAAGPAQVASEIAALPPIEPIARPAVHAFFGPNRSFVGSEPVEFPSHDFGRPVGAVGHSRSWACSAVVVAKGESRRRDDLLAGLDRQGTERFSWALRPGWRLAIRAPS
jgi:hypothetical protein